MKGPAVCDGVSLSKLPGISVSFPPVLEEGGAAAAQHDIEAIDQAVERHHARHVEPSDQAVDGGGVCDGVDDGTARNQRIALEIKLRHQPLHEGMAEHREVNMGRAPLAAAVLK